MKTKLILFAFMALSITSCKKEDAANQITDGSGITAKVTWKTYDNSNVYTNVDIDAYIFKGDIFTVIGNTPIQTSDNLNSFETLSFSNSLADGDYTIAVEYYDLRVAGSYEIEFVGNSTSKSYKLPAKAFFATEDGQYRYTKVVKKGSQFSIVNK